MEEVARENGTEENKVNEGVTLRKVNSVQEACARCFAVHKIWNLANHMKKQNIKMLNLLAKKSKGVMFFVSLFSCDLQNFKF